MIGFNTEPLDGTHIPQEDIARDHRTSLATGISTRRRGPGAALRRSGSGRNRRDGAVLHRAALAPLQRRQPCREGWAVSARPPAAILRSRRGRHCCLPANSPRPRTADCSRTNRLVAARPDYRRRRRPRPLLAAGRPRRRNSGANRVRVEETWEWLRTSPLLWLFVTVAAYEFGRWLRNRTQHPLAQPTLVAIVVCCIL